MSCDSRTPLLQCIIILLLAVIVYLLFTLIQTNDRKRAASERMNRRLQEIEEMIFSGSLNPVQSGTRTAEVPAANAGYFDPGAKHGGQLVTAISNDPPGLNPLTVNEATASLIYSLCNSSLGERDWQEPEKFRPLLAESWQVSPDNLAYTIRLRPNILWQSYTDPETGRRVPPRPVTAEDFKFALDVIRNPQVNCAPYRVYFKDLAEIEVIDPLKFVVRWQKPFYGSFAATIGLTPLPRHFYCDANGKFDADKFNNDHKRNNMIVGCGPYILDSWQRGRRIVLKRNPGYFGIRLGIAPPISTRVFEIIKHPNTRFQALISSKLDMLSLTPDQWQKRCDIPVFSSGKLKRYRYNSLGYQYIGYNHRNHCFSDRKTRQALTMLVDRRRILAELFYDLGKIINSPLIPGTKYADPKLTPYPFDPNRARALLREAGWRDSDGDGILERNGKRFEFTMLQVANHPIQSRMLPIIKESFAAAGIDMKLQVVEWGVYIDRLENHNFDACTLGWTGSFDPDFYQIFHSSQITTSGSNFISYRNPGLDREIIALRREFNIDKRIAIARKIERILYDDQPYTFLFCIDNLQAISGAVNNVRLFPFGIYPISFWK